MEKTLFELDSVPMGSFYLGINGDWYIQNNYVNIVKKWIKIDWCYIDGFIVIILLFYYIIFLLI